MQEQVSQELEQEEQVRKQIAQKKKELEELEEKLKVAAKNLEVQEKEKLDFLQKKYQLEQLVKEQKRLMVSSNEKQDELLGTVRQWKNVHAKSLRVPDFKALEVLRKKLFTKEKAFRDKQVERVALQEKIVAKKEMYQKRVMDCKRSYEREVADKFLIVEKAELAYKQLCEQLKQREKFRDHNKKKQHELQEKIEKIFKELHDYKPFQKEYEAVKAQFEKRRIFYQTLVQRGNWIQKEHKELDHKKLVVQDKKSPSCPLCEQVLTVKRKQFLARTFLKQEKFLTNRLDRITRLIKALKVLLFEQHLKVQKLSLQDEQYKQLQANEEAFRKMLVELQYDANRDEVEGNLLAVRQRKEENDLVVLRKALDEKKKEEADIIKRDEQVQLLERELGVLIKEQEKVKYDKKLHDDVLTQLHDCENQLQEQDELKTEISHQDERKRLVARLCKELKSCKQQIKMLQEKTQELPAKLEQEKTLEQQIQMIKDEHISLDKAKGVLLQELGSLENKLERLEKLKKEKEERENAIGQDVEHAKEYSVLAGIFGKDGIQALLIEEAIPEIEAESNRLLSRLTDNKSQVFIESLRDLKKGGVKETLDIHISDSYGIRPYEMFSGGEAFRIDFALRIAISKLLARRAGTALQTLIIDEGFASQDEDGLQRLMDAIYAIQKDFVKIIVVSHLPIFKDNFPVHFVVDKDSFGSVVRIEERG